MTTAKKLLIDTLDFNPAWQAALNNKPIANDDYVHQFMLVFFLTQTPNFLHKPEYQKFIQLSYDNLEAHFKKNNIPKERALEDLLQAVDAFFQNNDAKKLKESLEKLCDKLFFKAEKETLNKPPGYRKH